VKFGQGQLLGGKRIPDSLSKNLAQIVSRPFTPLKKMG